MALLARCLAPSTTSIQELQALAHIAGSGHCREAAVRACKEGACGRGRERQARAADVRVTMVGGVQLTAVPQPFVQLAPAIPDMAVAVDAALGGKRKADAVAAPGVGGKVEGQLESRQTQAVQASAVFFFCEFQALGQENETNLARVVL